MGSTDGPVGVTLAAALAPLVRGSTYRRGVYLLLGAVVALPYVLLSVAFAQSLSVGPRAPGLLLLAVTVPIVVLPAFLRGTRAIEITAARGLLDVDLPDLPAGSEELRWESRLRSALWFAVHLVVGGLVGLGLLIALPMALLFLAQQVGIGGESLSDLSIGPLEELGSVGWSLLGLVLLLGLVYGVAGLGAGAALMAPVLLGPSAAERIAALEAAAGQLAERNRLARELHDSVGHALTVTTLQAGAARRVLDSDPEFARTALAAIEETGRAAMDDLDHVLGLLRQSQDARTTTQPTLSDLDRLVADARAAGLDVRAEPAGPLMAESGLDAGTLPAAVSREGYRIVQEGLTNAARHAGKVAVTLRVAVSERWLEIELANPVPGGEGERAAGGRGLAGMRERVDLLGGTMTAGPDGGDWRVRVRLPTGGRPGRRRG